MTEFPVFRSVSAPAPGEAFKGFSARLPVSRTPADPPSVLTTLSGVTVVVTDDLEGAGEPQSPYVKTTEAP